MALIKYSALVAEARGKLGDIVLSRNQYGAYVRGKGKLIDPESAAQLTVRARLIAASQAWRTLTDNQRLAWHDASQRATRHNVFGDASPLTGNAFFVRKYLRAIAADITPPTDPPYDSAPTQPTNLHFSSLSVGGGIQVTAGLTELLSTEVCHIWAATNVSPGKTFIASQYRLVYTVPGDQFVAQTITNECAAYFGNLIEGKRAFAKIVIANILSLSHSGSIHVTGIIGS
jgi:hypothetical protein